jgi:hypothetical protein
MRVLTAAGTKGGGRNSKSTLSFAGSVQGGGAGFYADGEARGGGGRAGARARGLNRDADGASVPGTDSWSADSLSCPPWTRWGCGLRWARRGLAQGHGGCGLGRAHGLSPIR